MEAIEETNAKVAKENQVAVSTTPPAMKKPVKKSGNSKPSPKAQAQKPDEG
jgi:hypothetical protein